MILNKIGFIKKYSFIYIILSFIMSISGVLDAQQLATTKIEVYSTSIVKKNAEQPLQIGMVEIKNGRFNKLECTVEFSGNKSFSYLWENLNESSKSIPFEFPVLSEQQDVKIIILHEGNLIFNKTVQFNPPKIWNIYDIQVSHHDLGYADYYHMMRRDVREMGIEMALDFCRQTDNNPDESKFRWTIETSEPLLPFLQKQNEEVIQDLVTRIKQGRIALGSIHNSASTEHMSYEAMARLFYTPNRFVRDWLEIPLAKTALNTDVVGFILSTPLFAKEADIPYFFFGRNSAVNEFEHLQEEPAFYWNPQDGDSRSLLCKVFEYYSPDRLVQYNVEELSAYLSRYEIKSNWPYNCLMAEDSYDFSVPSLSNIDGIKKWNSEYSNPVIISGTFDMFFDDLAGQEDKRPFEEFAKDVPNSWSDQDLSDAQYAGKVHQLGYHLPEVEKFSTMAMAFGGGRYPWEEIYQGYNRLLMYAEHTNGAYAEGPIYVPESLYDESADNASYYEVESKMHRALVEESEEFTQLAGNDTYEKFAKLITRSSDYTVLVFNSLNFVRDDQVNLMPPLKSGMFKLIDNSTKEDTPYQCMPNGSISFIARAVPSIGYKSYSLKKTKSPEISTASVKRNSIENEFYLITVNEKTGSIESIFDKELNRELVDQKAPWDFNDYIFQRYETVRYDEEMSEYRADSATVNCSSGELLSTLISDVYAVGSDSIRQIVKLHKGIKRIDFELQLHKAHSGRTLSLYREGIAKNKEALFYSFPLAIEDFTIRHELPGGSVEPIADQSAGSSTDYYAIQHYCDISNKDFGITFTLRNPNLVEYGTPRVAPWNKGDGFESILKKAEKPYVFLYLTNNMFFTNIRQSQHNLIELKWSLTSHRGDWQEGQAYKTGWQDSHPFISVLMNGKNEGNLPEDSYSFLKTDCDHVVCSTIKTAEANGEGFILRFFELAGKAATVQAELNFGMPLATVVETNLIEDNRSLALSVNKGKVKFDIAPFGIKTLRIVHHESDLPEILKLHAEAISDQKVELSWKIKESRNDALASYRVYRSQESDFEPSPRTYLGSTDLTRFSDEPVLNYGGWISTDLDPSTTYYYRVVPLGKNNCLGKVPGTVEVVTLESNEKNQPPHQVEGLYVTHISDIAPFNYNALFFYTNIEDDVHIYQIHRSKNEGFIPSTENRIATVDATVSFEHVTPHGFATVSRELKEFNRQLYIDQDIQDGDVFYYRVCAVDESGQSGTFSKEVGTKSSVKIIDISGTQSFSEESVVEIIPEINSQREIRYTIDGSDPTIESFLYRAPFTIKETMTIKSRIFEADQKSYFPVAEKSFYKSNDYKVTYNISYDQRWPSTGDLALVDNAKGKYYTDGLWQGVEFVDLDLVIDLKSRQEVKDIKATFLGFPAPWIFLPEYVEFYISADGENFTLAKRINTKEEEVRNEDLIKEYSVRLQNKNIRFIRVFAKNQQYCPAWHSSAGGKAWIFVDEVVIK